MKLLSLKELKLKIKLIQYLKLHLIILLFNIFNVAAQNENNDLKVDKLKLNELQNQNIQIENSKHITLLDSENKILLNDTTNLTNIDSLKKMNNSFKKTILLGGTIGTFAVTQIYQYKDYWSNRGDFTIMNWQTEYDDALLADKLGHLYFTYGLSKVYSNALQWSGYNKEESILYGSVLAFSYQLYVEIQDGFSKGQPYLGLSRGDILANFIGAIYPNLQLNNKILENINFKINFKKSDNYDRLGYSNIINDYESTYHWVSFDLYNLLNENTKNYWTPYLNLALGHSVKNINRYGSGNHEFYVSLDINFNPLKELIGIDNLLVNSIFEFINLYKIPSPTIKVHPEVVWVGFKI